MNGSSILAPQALAQSYFRDRSGRLLPLRLLALALAFAPAAVLAYRAATTGLGSKPLTAAIHFVGDWSLYLLLITLAVTPLRLILAMPKLIQMRRILGLSALGYAVLHLVFFTLEQGSDLGRVLSEIIKRPYLQIGTAALLMLVVLGITSRDAMVQKLGSLTWNRLHLIVHPIAFLGLLHFFLQSKIDVSRAVLATAVYLWLVLFRALRANTPLDGPKLVLAVAPLAALLTALAEATWYGTRTGIGWLIPLQGNFDWSYEISAAWQVFGGGLAMAAVSLIFWRTGKRIRSQSA